MGKFKGLDKEDIIPCLVIISLIIVFIGLNILTGYNLFWKYSYHPDITECSLEEWRQYGCHPDYYEKCEQHGVYGIDYCFDWAIGIIIVDITIIMSIVLLLFGNFEGSYCKIKSEG